MANRLSAVLAVLVLAGCASVEAEDEPQSYTTRNVYGTVTAISGNDLTVQSQQDGTDFTVSMDSSLVIYEDNETILPSQIQINDELLCTYTDGELTVIAVIKKAS
ncbi:MAG: hypothetical protein SOI44_03145 [Lactimicrobium sp.]|jgi:uncharacterized protein YceK|uniref:hypothetical protein n=1 Tax=Lactimicrobium sp. TaxID=2563780 RepID=UPI002F35B52F